MSKNRGENRGAVTIYHAAALFCGREAFFNAALTHLLETRFEYVTVLPQRDGFEFGRLQQAMESHLPPEEIASAVGTIVYYLDVGRFLPASHVVVANLDEPLDEGVVTEMCYAKLCGKPVIGFRTDVRSPYGRPGDQFAGMHFFPPFQCDEFIREPMPCRNSVEAQAGLERLAGRIDAAVQRLTTVALLSAPAENPALDALRRGTAILFDGIEEIHSERGLNQIAERYRRHVDELLSLGPRISRES